MNQLHSIEKENLCNGHSRNDHSASDMKVLPDMVQAGDGTHIDAHSSYTRICSESATAQEVSTEKINGIPNEEENTCTITTSDEIESNSEDVFRDPKTFEFLFNLGNSKEAANLRKISLFKKFDPLVGASPIRSPHPTETEPKGPKESKEPKEPLESKNEESILVDTSIPFQEEPHDLPHKGSTSVKSASVSSTPERSRTMNSPKSENIASPLNSVQKVSVEISTLNMSPRSPAPSSESKAPRHKQAACSTPKSHHSYQVRRVNASPRHNFEDAMSTIVKDENYVCCSSDVLREEINLLREILVKQEFTYRDSLRAVELELQESHKREEELKKQLIDQSEGQLGLQVIMDEYEKTVSQLVSEKERAQEEFEKKMMEMDATCKTTQEDLASQESSFFDLHKKYEKTKELLTAEKQNMVMLQKKMGEYEHCLKKHGVAYQKLKTHAEEQLDSANQKMKELKQHHQIEVTKLKMLVKKSELKISSLEETILHKNKENLELMTMCDELVNRGTDSTN